MKHNYLVLFVLIFSTYSFASSNKIEFGNEQEVANIQNTPLVYGDASVQEFKKSILLWEGELTTGEQWAIYSDSCGGTLLGTTTKNAFTVTPSRAHDTFYVRAVGNQIYNCGSFQFNFDAGVNSNFSYPKDSFSKQDPNPLPTQSPSSNGIYKSFDTGLSLNQQTGEIDLANTSPGYYAIYFLPFDSQLGYSVTTLDVENTAILSVATTTQAAEDLTDGLFTITSSAAPAVDVIVTISVTGTATGGRDYASIGSTFTFPAGQTTATIPVDVIPDSALEGTETIIIDLLSTDNTDVTIGTPSTASMNLTDNDSASVNIADASGNEDDGAITITATLSNAVQGGFSVDLSTIDASATVADNDYTPIVNQTLTFAGTSGETQSITFFPTADTVLENDETLIISMSNLAGTSLPVNITNSSIVTILNDEVDCSNAAAISANFQTFDSGCATGASGAASAVLFYDGFENAQATPNEYRDSVDPIPGLPQWRYEGAPSVNARLSVFSNGAFNRANNGSVGLGLDAGNFVPHSIILSIDLSQEAGSDDLVLSYASFNSSDENTLEDVVSIRGDINQPWVVLSDWNSGSANRWITREADIDAVLTAAGQTVSANTEIRFTQSDNFQFSTDGVVFDDVMIYKEGYTYLWSNNETTGVIQDLQPGDYSVVITSPEGCTTTLNGTVGGLPGDDASFTYPSTNFCQGATNIIPTVTGLTGGIFFSTPFGLAIDNLTGEIDTANSIAGRTYIVTYQTNGTCPNSSDVSVTIDPSEDASFFYSTNSYSQGDGIQFPSFVGTFGGTFSSTPSGLVLDPNTGAIDTANSAIGNYTISYTTAGTCPGVSTQQIIINDLDVVPPIARCQPFVGQLDANGVLSIQAFNVDAGSTDDVSIASLSVSQDLFTCADLGVNTVTLTVTDTSGNTSSCDTTVTVEDVDAPVLQCADVTLELDANGQASLNNGSFASVTDYDVAPISLNIETLDNENLLNLGDDQVTANLPVGFDFNYFGNTYSDFRISSNGFIGFGGLANSGCCQGGNLESGNVFPSNIIALAWTDLNPGGAANIGYQTIGTSPNRKLIVNFSNTPAFGGAGNITGQIHLFESSGRIEIHTFSNTVNRPQTQGILNADSSVGIPVPGRNAGVWNAFNDAYSFTPANIFATDNCTLTSLVVSKLDFTCADLGVNSVSISATDAAGNNANCSFFVTVVDNQLPTPAVATLPDVTASCEVTSLTPPVVTDNCASNVSITNNASLPIRTQGTTVVTWVYNDGNGNFSFQNQNVVINDTTAPVPDVTNLPDILASCDVTSLTPPTATEASCNNGDITVNGTSDASLPITQAGTTVVTWSYTDANGNVSTQTQNVIINDNIAPVADVINLPALTDQCEITSLTAPTATDNCSPNVSVTNDVTLPIVSSTTITWSYEDANGNISTQTQSVIINDTLAPVPDLTTLSDVQSVCEVTSLTAPTASDNCSGSVTAVSDVTLPISSQGSTLVTWTYTDGNGNSTTQTQNIIITDSIAPVADVANLPDITSECAITGLTAPTATDNCAGTLIATSDVTLPVSTQGTTVVTWTYDDGNGNSTTQTQNLIISDNIAPTPDVANLPAIDSQCAVTSLTPPTATDNCSSTVIVTSDATLPITSGATVVTWTYDDGNGNSTTQTQNVTVSDNIAPTPDVTNLPAIDSQCAVTSLTEPTATDNCSATVIVTNNAVLPITTGTTVVTWTYDDGNGNVITQDQTINVNDTTAPVADLQSLPDVLGQCEVTTLTPPTATDNCSATVTVTNDVTLPLTAASTVVTWTFDDGNGNISTQTQNVLVNDDTAPTATCPQDVVVSVSGTEYTVLDYTTGLAATDNCSDASALTVTQSIVAGSVVAVPSTNTITVTITDENGNDRVCTFELRVEEALSNGDVAFDDFSIKFYPNPTQGIIYISSDKERMESIELIDFRGRLVKTWKLSSLNDTQIDISEFESAIYFVRIKTENHVINRRVIKD